MKHNSAKFWLRVVGLLTIVLAVAGFYLEWSSTLEHIRDQGTAGLSESVIRTYQILRMVSYMTLLFFVASGLLLFKLRPIASYLLLITSVFSLILFSLPIFFFLAPGLGLLPIPTTLSFDLRYASGYAATGHVLFGVILFPFWAPPLAFKCFRSLSVADNSNETEENETTFNKAIETDRY